MSWSASRFCRRLCQAWRGYYTREYLGLPIVERVELSGSRVGRLLYVIANPLKAGK